MSGRKSKFLVPYRNGELQQYAYGNSFGHPEYGRSGEEWRENIPFEATMTISDMYSGRSAKGLIWTDENGKKYTMFVSDAIELLAKTVINKGSVTGTWIVRKRGQNYGIGILIEE